MKSSFQLDSVFTVLSTSQVEAFGSDIPANCSLGLSISRQLNYDFRILMKGEMSELS